MPRDVGVVLVAAGRGSRLGGDQPKQFIAIGGVPMVLRALRPFVSHPDVAQVALVLPPDAAARPPDFLRDALGPGLVVAAGGPERTASVAAGLAALDRGCTTVLVHDAARPFVERPVIDAVIAHARAGEGAVAALRVSDTLKEADGVNGTRVRRTVARDGLWRAQTPQGFPRDVLERAYAAAGSAAATDDAALVESLGVAVHLVPDSPRNLKITTADDLVLAELLASVAP